MTRTKTIPMLIALTTAAGLAIAQPAKQNRDDNDLLRGPAVVETDSAVGTQDQEKLMRADFKENPVAMREVLGALRALGNVRSGNNPLELSPEQDQQIKDAMKTYREDIRVFQQDNVVKIRGLRDQMNKEARERRERDQKQAENKDEPADAMSEQGENQDAMRDRPEQKESDAARKLRKFIASAPANKAAMKTIKETLSDEQYAMVQKHVFKTRQRASERGADRGTARRGVDSDRVREQQQDREGQRGKGENKRDKPIDD